jgi:DNA helicase-2/ATP-dependent DNA helicase PcrA
MSFQVSNKDFEANLNRLDDSQSAAVTSDADHVVIRAAAGSGKTSTLITAIANYRYEHINDRICAITYTRAARAEMETRLRNMGIYDVEVSTIHVWSRNMLDYFANKYDFKIKILEEPHIKSILREIVKEYLIRSRIKSINIDILYTYITGSKTMDITDNYRRTLNALEERYILYKRNNGLYDFTDYPQYLWDVMSAYDEYINTIDALFVDEFQDVDSVQCEIFEKVNANKKFFIGDP